MPSDRQIKANRRNAKLSSGPRTSAGKAASRRNALTHGLSRHDGKTTGAVQQEDGYVTNQVAKLWTSEETLAQIRAYRCVLLVQIMARPEPALLKRLRGLERYERAAYAGLRRALRASGSGVP